MKRVIIGIAACLAIVGTVQARRTGPSTEGATNPQELELLKQAVIADEAQLKSAKSKLAADKVAGADRATIRNDKLAVKFAIGTLRSDKHRLHFAKGNAHAQPI